MHHAFRCGRVPIVSVGTPARVARTALNVQCTDLMSGASCLSSVKARKDSPTDVPQAFHVRAGMLAAELDEVCALAHLGDRPWRHSQCTLSVHTHIAHSQCSLSSAQCTLSVHSAHSQCISSVSLSFVVSVWPTTAQLSVRVRACDANRPPAPSACSRASTPRTAISRAVVLRPLWTVSPPRTCCCRPRRARHRTSTRRVSSAHPTPGPVCIHLLRLHPWFGARKAVSCQEQYRVKNSIPYGARNSIVPGTVSHMVPSGTHSDDLVAQ
jgi:hypothetical protein